MISLFVAILTDGDDWAKKKAEVPNESKANIGTWQVGPGLVLALTNFIKILNELVEWSELVKPSWCVRLSLVKFEQRYNYQNVKHNQKRT